MMAPSNAAERMIHFRLRMISHESDRVVSIFDCEAEGSPPGIGTGGPAEPDGKLLLPEVMLR
jgi:hypothetical protein